jgi:hypothetical protein
MPYHRYYVGLANVNGELYVCAEAKRLVYNHQKTAAG